MSSERHVRLFRNGRNQAVRIPREFELPGDDAVMRREGDRLVIVPARKDKDFIAFLDSLEPSDEEELPMIDDPPTQPEDII